MFFKICANMKILFGLIGLKTVHTKSKCVLEPKLQNPLFDLVCLSFLCYFLFLEERDIKVMGNELKYKWTK